MHECVRHVNALLIQVTIRKDVSSLIKDTWAYISERKSDPLHPSLLCHSKHSSCVVRECLVIHVKVELSMRLHQHHANTNTRL
jgi:hypothetical protein